MPGTLEHSVTGNDGGFDERRYPLVISYLLMQQYSIFTHFTVNIIKDTKLLKKYYSEHLYIHHLDSIIILFMIAIFAVICGFCTVSLLLRAHIFFPSVI